MPTVSIVYFSGAGHTAKLAEAVREGAASVAGVKTNLIAINGDDIVKGRYANDEVFAKLDASDAIIFGSPTYMGGPAAQFKAFADASAGKWFGRVWRDKIAAGFTVSNSPSGDKFSTLQYLHTLAMQHGMIWVGLGELPLQPNGVNRLGGFGGAMGQAGQESPEEKPSAEDKATGEILGKRVANFVLKLNK
ncbi:MAG TPA: flavodoxin family protein [Verrucomicrobiae bacterium]|nr:flavodoxin family protein [Verrucomicrobiae bacterium]